MHTYIHTNIHTYKHTYIHTSGADLGNYGWGGGRVCVIKGEALDRGTKFRAGGGMGGGCPPPYLEEN